MSIFFLRRGDSPVRVKRASDYALGESVFIKWNNTLTEFIVVRQINVDSNIYDASCVGTWLMTKDIVKLCDWNTNNEFVDYTNSNVYQYLNNEFVNLLDTDLGSFLHTNYNIPFRRITASTDEEKINTIISSAFLPAFSELINENYTDKDGEYFGFNVSTPLYEGQYVPWWTRSLETANNMVIQISEQYSPTNPNGFGINDFTKTLGVRPIIIISYETPFSALNNIYNYRL